INVAQSGSQILFQTDKTTIISRLLEGDYPETNRLIPTEYKTTMTVNRESLLSSMERSIILADDSNKVVKLETLDEESGMFEMIRITKKNPEAGQSIEDVALEEK